jgi:HK97 family phage major capsid protein/HK97 family phage prohead protease
MDPKDKTPTALPMQRVDLVATITRRAPAEDAIARKAALEAARKARAAGPGDDPEDDDEGDDEIYDISLSSDTPIDRGWYTETLDHSASAVNLDRAATGINLLWNHNSSQPIGRVSNLASKGGKLVGEAKFYSHSGAQEKRSMVDEGLREVSVGYSVQSYEYTPGTAEAGDAYRATRWTPLEASLAPVPADNSVGISAQRAAGDTQFPVLIRSTNAAPAVSQEQRTMNETERAAAEAAAQAKAKLPTEIARLARQHGMADKTAEWLEAGHSIDKVREIILEAKGTREDTVTGPSTNNGIDLPAKDAREYSYSRAIISAVELREGVRGVKCLEIEVSDALERSMPSSHKRRGGLYIPMSLRSSGIHESGGQAKPMSPATRQLITQFQRSGVIDSNTVNALKEVVFTEYGGELIEILRNMALVVAMGARVLTGLSSPISFPRQLTDAVATWIAENPGSPGVTQSNPTTDLVTLNPHTLMASSAYSRQLLIQASVDVEAFVRSSIAAAHALAYDLAGIHGTGQNNQPLGIYNQPGVGTVDFTAVSGYGATGNKISYAGCIQMEVLVANANALLGTLGYMTTPGIGGDAKNTLKFPGAAVAQGAPLWEGPLQDGGEMNGYKARATNQVAKTMGAAGAPTGGTFHGLIYGNWADMLIGQFGGAMEMIVDPYTLARQGLIQVTSFQMADVAIRHPGSFAVATGLNA